MLCCHDAPVGDLGKYGCVLMMGVAGGSDIHSGVSFHSLLKLALMPTYALSHLQYENNGKLGVKRPWNMRLITNSMFNKLYRIILFTVLRVYNNICSFISPK